MRFLIGFLTLTAASFAALVAMMVAHALSGRALWGMFIGSAMHIRQLSVYGLDYLPFFAVIVFAAAQLASRLGGSRELSLNRFLLAVFVGAGAAVVIHLPFFDTDPRGIVVAGMMAAFTVAIYPAILAVFFRWRFVPDRLRPSPWVGYSLVAAVFGLALFVLYIGMFRAGAVPGQQPETETYRDDLMPTRTAQIFQPVTEADRRLANSLAVEPTPLTGGNVVVFDMDGDGLADAITFRLKRSPMRFWKNTGKGFVEVPDFFKGIPDKYVQGAYPADYDNDGDIDILVVNRVEKSDSQIVNTFFKKLFWYPFQDADMYGRLYERTADGGWRDVSAKAFPKGLPWGFRKVEPVNWMDINGDGKLDFIWSQYPHGRRSLNGLYIQGEGGVFEDRLMQTVDHLPRSIFPEGSDIADFDGDGDMDFFGYGYAFRNEGGAFKQMCDPVLPGVPCSTSGRTDEGGLFEDLDGDGKLDFVLSYHGVGGKIPKYFLQLFRGTGDAARPFERISELGQEFYGFNTFMRAKDFDLDGHMDLLVNTPGRLLRLDGQRWLDALPLATGLAPNALEPIALLDADDDGDWDIIAEKEDKIVLLRNRLDPKAFIRLDVAGPGGIANQYGATITARLPDGRVLVRPYRHHAGYAGFADPRVIIPYIADGAYEFRVCFPSTNGSGAAASNSRIEVIARQGNCTTYRLRTPDRAAKFDITFVSGGEAFRIREID